MLAIIPARGGSKGIPKKNMVVINGKTLLEHTINSALGSKYITNIILSTDDEEIAEEGIRCGLEINYKRPIEMSLDETSMVETLEHCFEWVLEEKMGHTEFILLQPTSPLRSRTDIDNSIDLFRTSGAVSLASVNQMYEHPNECIEIIEDNNWKYLVQNSVQTSRRQDYKDTYFYINGAIYISSLEFLLKNRLLLDSNNLCFYVMPKERSVDVDTYYDLAVAEALMKNLQIS